MALYLVFAFVLGATIGSFLNVVIYRLPKGKSIVAPPSSCPHCGHRLGALELIPILSWLLQRGRCKHCGQPISARYPLIEALTGGLFAFAFYHIPTFPEVLLVWFLMAMLVALSFIDIDTYTLPWSLMYPTLGVAWVASAAVGFPQEVNLSINDAVLAAGLLALIGEYGSLLVRRFKSGKAEGPIGLQTIHLAAMVGAWAGPAAGLVAGFLNASLNTRSKTVLRLPDGLSLGLALLGPLVALAIPLWLTPLQSLSGLFISAGGIALAGGLYWWIQELRKAPPPPDDPDEVVVLGFGDVVLAGVLAAWVGFWPFMAGLMVGVFAGAILGVLLRARRLPFGPYLAIGGVVALFFGQDLISWYLAYIGGI